MFRERNQYLRRADRDAADWFRPVLEKDIDAENDTPGSSRIRLSHLISFPAGLTRKEGKMHLMNMAM
jgi:hypothetical protein